MTHLLDVSVLAACAWGSHERHTAANRWLGRIDSFATCPLTQMGFLRVSMRVAYGARFLDARAALDAILKEPAHRFIADDSQAAALSEISSRHDVTDAHLVSLARAHGLRLATLDDALCDKPWAQGVAMNPLKTP
jgi:toxin-antitoxin system PIN domain toxin